MPAHTAQERGRLDTVVSELGLAASRNRAAREIRAGRVSVNGRTVTRPAASVDPGSVVRLESPEIWVARSAHKLLGALEDFNVDPTAAVCLDAGASTGGFTQVLLAHGAAGVHAVDVGHGQLVDDLAADPRVRDLPGHNIRSLTPAALTGDAPFHSDGTVDLIVADLSFISLTLVLDALLSVARHGAPLLLMVKPQFELDRAALDKHGVVTSPHDRRRALARVEDALASAGALIVGTAPSRLPGPSGNIEHFIYAEAQGPHAPVSSVRAVRPVRSITVERGAGTPADPFERPSDEEDL